MRDEVTDKTQSAPQLFLEDLASGRTFRFGDYPVTREEVIEFATRYDPQPYHLDDAAAAANPIFGRLCASGMHTLSMAHRLQMSGFGEVGLHPLAGLGMDEMRVLSPVYPGDTLYIEVEFTELRPSQSRPDRGLASYLTTVRNQDEKAVLTYRSTLFLGRRPGSAIPE